VQERSGNTLKLISISNDFLNRIQMTHQLRERIAKWDYMKLKSFCTTKEMITKFKRQPTEWRKSLQAIYLTITRIYQELKINKLPPPKINDPMKKWENELNRAQGLPFIT
jgi:hypothetical protein